MVAGVPAPHDTYFMARRTSEGVETRGDPQAFFGHRLEQSVPPDAGNWVAWDWNGARLEVRNDRFGAYQVYYSASTDEVAVSPSIDRLLRLGISRELDYDALSAFLGLGFFVGQDTPFRAIRALQPGGSLSWRPEVLAVAGGPRPLSARTGSARNAVDGIIETVRAATSRRIPEGDGGFVMPLSGGRDSRHILLELRRQGQAPRLCITARRYPLQSDRKQAPSAARLCATLGLAHRAVGPPAPILASEMRKNRMTNYCADDHTWSLALADAMDERVRHTYDGLGGGTLLQRPWERQELRALLEAGRLEEMAAALVRKEDGKALMDVLLSPSLRGTISTERAAARILEDLQLHLTAPDPQLELYFWNRAMRELSLVSSGILASIPVVYTPYLDPDFVEFAASLPSEAVGKRVHEQAIAKAFPQVAHVPYARKAPQRSGRRFARHVNRNMARLLAAESNGSLVDRRGLLRRATVGAVTGDDWFTRGHNAALVTLLVQLEMVVERGPARSA